MTEADEIREELRELRERLAAALVELEADRQYVDNLQWSIQETKQRLREAEEFVQPSLRF